jgi:hypothetical protein
LIYKISGGKIITPSSWQYKIITVLSVRKEERWQKKWEKIQKAPGQKQF